MPTGHFSPQAPHVVHSYTARTKSRRALSSRADGPISLAFSPSVFLMNSLNTRIFSGGDMEGSPVTVCTGHHFRHSPQRVHASSSTSCLADRQPVKEPLSLMHQPLPQPRPLPGARGHYLCREHMELFGERDAGDEREHQERVKVIQDALNAGYVLPRGKPAYRPGDKEAQGRPARVRVPVVGDARALER